MSTPSASNPVRVRRVEVKNLARVEGEGALHIEATGDQVTDVRLQIYEPPRFFEAFMRILRLRFAVPVIGTSPRD